MEMITVKNKVKGDVQKVWDFWTAPEHITNWNFAADSWQCPHAINDVQPGGKFSWRMEAKDGSMGFDYAGTYEQVSKLEQLRKRLGDGRLISIKFVEKDGVTEVIESFEPDGHDPELQRQGWQAILDNFKKYVEAN